MTVGGKNVHCFVSEAKKIVCIKAATPAIEVTDLPEEDPPITTPELCRRTLVKSSDPDKFFLVQVRGLSFISISEQSLQRLLVFIYLYIVTIFNNF